MQLHILEEWEAEDLESFKINTDHKFDGLIKEVSEECGLDEEDWDQELVSSIETVLDKAYPDMLVCGTWYESNGGWAQWGVYEIPERLSNVAYNVLERPLEEMPTLINSKLKPEADLASWRLKKGI